MRERFLIGALIGAAALGSYACGGSSSSSSGSSAPAATESAAAAPAAAAGDATAGKAVFTASCGGCHTLADAGTSGAVGPNLDDAKPDAAKVSSQVTNGGGSMPAFKDKLSEAEIADVAAYVSSVAGT